MKKYKINHITNSIESFTFVCDHPENNNYVVVLDEYKNPQKMTKSSWEEMIITDYKTARKEYIKSLRELINFYKGEN